MNKNYVIFGGGVAGIVASIYIAKNGDNAYLIEKEKKLGGLLNSLKLDDDYSFDFGTHIIRQTGVEELDKILLKNIDNRWSHLDVLKAGNYFEKKINSLSQAISILDFPKEEYQKALVEILSKKDCSPENYENLESYLFDYFGETITNRIFRPLLSKNYGQDLITLSPLAHLLFGYSRVIVGDEFISRELKQSKIYDKKISFTSFNEGISPLKNWYPKGEGIALWVDGLVEQALEYGVNIVTDAEVESLSINNKTIDYVKLNNGESIKCDKLIWTLPPVFLLKLLSLDVTLTKPLFRKSVINHYVFDSDFCVNNHFIMCNDPDMKSYRITLYPNIGERVDKRPSCTVETLMSPEDEHTDCSSEAVEELRQMGIIKNDANVTFNKEIVLHNGFPVLTTDFIDSLNLQTKSIKDSVDNVIFLGKASGKNFFMNDVLTEVHEQLNRI